MNKRFLASILLCLLLIAVAYGLFRHLTYTKIRIENASDDTITAVNVLTKYGAVLPVELKDGEGKISFAPNSEGTVSLLFERNGVLVEIEEYGYIAPHLGGKYLFVIQDNRVKFKRQE